MPKILISAVGDINLENNYEALLKKNGLSFPFKYVKEDLNKSDLLFGHLESLCLLPALNKEKKFKNKRYSNPNIFKCLKEVSFDVLSLASNHALDYGWESLLYTKKLVESYDIKTVGVGNNSKEANEVKIVEIKGMRIGFIAYLEPCNSTLEGGGGRIAFFHIDNALRDIRKYKKSVDFLIVSFHGDNEFQNVPSIPKVEKCRKMAQAGADLILCHHPHVPQGIEKYDNSLIAYSLGQLVFPIDKYMINGSKETFKNHILNVEIENNKIVNWYRKYYKSDSFRPVPLEDSERIEHAKHYEYIDDILKNPVELRHQWHKSCLRYLKKYWPHFISEGPEKFIDNIAWKILNLPEHENWVKGIFEMAKDEYMKKKDKDDCNFRNTNK